MTLFSYAQNATVLQPNNETTTTINCLKGNGTHKSTYLQLLEVDTGADTRFVYPINIRTCKLHPTDLKYWKQLLYKEVISNYAKGAPVHQRGGNKHFSTKQVFNPISLTVEILSYPSTTLPLVACTDKSNTVWLCVSCFIYNLLTL